MFRRTRRPLVSETARRPKTHRSAWPWSRDRPHRSAARQRHACPMRHATEADLDAVEALLVELRRLPELRERRRGSFSRGSRAFLYFHEDAGEFYVDVRLDGAFRRAKVTTADEQADLLAQVRR